MNDPQGQTEALFGALRNSADADVVAAIETLVRDGADRLCAASTRSPSRPSTGSTRSGSSAPFCMPRGSACSSCPGTCSAPAAAACSTPARTLKTVHKDEYDCALCACGYEPTLDEMVEVTFTVSPRVRRIAAHDPTRCRSSNISARSSGARASTCRTTTSNGARRDHARAHRAAAGREGACCRCSCRPSSSSCSIR